jgi:hypothetical protein
MYNELGKIDIREKKKRFRCLNVILKCAEWIIDYGQMPYTVWQEAMDRALKKDIETFYLI